MGTGTKIVWKCDVCNHEWLSRDNLKPLRCASCKTPYWDKPSKQKITKKKITKPKVRGAKIK